MVITLGLPFIMIIGALGIALYAGNGGSRLKLREEGLKSVEDSLEESDDDQYWKGGLIYYNIDDPSVFVEKRVGIGWTVNMGTMQGKLLIMGTLIVTVGIIVMGIMYS